MSWGRGDALTIEWSSVYRSGVEEESDIESLESE